MGLPTRHHLSYNNGRRVALQLKCLVDPDCYINSKVTENGSY